MANVGDKLEKRILQSISLASEDRGASRMRQSERRASQASASARRKSGIAMVGQAHLILQRSTSLHVLAQPT